MHSFLRFLLRWFTNFVMLWIQILPLFKPRMLVSTYQISQLNKSLLVIEFHSSGSAILNSLIHHNQHLTSLLCNNCGQIFLVLVLCRLYFVAVTFIAASSAGNWWCLFAIRQKMSSLLFFPIPIHLLLIFCSGFFRSWDWN